MQPTENNSSPKLEIPGDENEVDDKTNCNNVKVINDNDTKRENENCKKLIDEDQSGETGKEKLLRWINKQMKIEMTDGRVLIGVFLCTDRDGNVILGSCSEYLTEACGFFDEPRMLGLVMVPGRHIVTIHHAPNNVDTETA